jgi:diaminopimelate epimerase
MLVNFCKYEGAGNDFVIVDDRKKVFPAQNHDLVKKICDRRFGIGADGLMLLRPVEGYDFNMVYYNSDGKESTMCGNGGRCIAAFAHRLGIVGNSMAFLAVDGEHKAELTHNNEVRLKMKDVEAVESGNDFYYLNTGSPQYVKFVTRLNDLDVFKEGRAIRYNQRFAQEGTNVDFVEDMESYLFVRTYERGVEDETLACGTGVTASVISAYLHRKLDSFSFSQPVVVKGGNLKVSFIQSGNVFSEIWLEGPGTFVFKGEIEI